VTGNMDRTRAMTVRGRSRGAGFSLLEMVIVLIILSLLATAAIPLMRNAVQRERELELREGLRELRRAIDEYKLFVETRPDLLKIQEEKSDTGYPKRLEVLVEGIELNMPGVEDRRKKFLRRMPVDPMTGSTDWGVRSSTDLPTATSSNGDDVFDVFSKSNGVGLDGTKYKDW
jgi:general secretion pathway protein G